MKLWLTMAVAALLTGCATLRAAVGPGGYPGDTQDDAALRGLAGDAVLEMRALIRTAGAGGQPDVGAALLAVQRAQVAAVSHGPAGPSAGAGVLARHAVLGLALAICRQGVERLDDTPMSSADTARQVAVLRIGCLTPLTLWEATAKGN